MFCCLYKTEIERNFHTVNPQNYENIVIVVLNNLEFRFSLRHIQRHITRFKGRKFF